MCWCEASSRVFFTSPVSGGLTVRSEETPTSPQVCAVPVITVPLHCQPKSTHRIGETPTPVSQTYKIQLDVSALTHGM